MSIHLYIKRNKKSIFDFTLNFHKGMCFHLLKDLWDNYYKHYQKDLNDLCMEYIIVKKFMETLEGNGGHYSKKELEEIYVYFIDTHSISLKDYVTDFVSCSNHCNDVINKIAKLSVNV